MMIGGWEVPTTPAPLMNSGHERMKGCSRDPDRGVSDASCPIRNRPTRISHVFLLAEAAPPEPTCRRQRSKVVSPHMKFRSF